MKEIPMLFSTPMVQAILDGRKTMTRRIVKGGIDPNPYSHVKLLEHERKDIGLQAFFFNEGDEDCWGIKYKYGKVGDVIWVRESFGYILHDKSGPLLDSIFFKADDTGDAWDGPWKPSIHMPKDAARIWLEVTNIRVERAWAINEADAVAEGILSYKEEDGSIRYKDYVSDASGYGHPDHDYPTVGVAVISFATLWESINGLESWEANPWVWVVEFKVLSTTGRPTNNIPPMTGAIATEAQ